MPALTTPSRLVGFLLLALTSGSCVRIPPAEVAREHYPQYRKQYAIVIGANRYPDPDTGKVDHLAAPPYDACRMAHYFQDQGAEVTCCFKNKTDDRGNRVLDFKQPFVPTLTHLEKVIAQHYPNGNKSTGADTTRLMIYLSGHSRTVIDPETRDERTFFFLPQIDSPPSQIKDNELSGPYLAQCSGATDAVSVAQEKSGFDDAHRAIWTALHISGEVAIDFTRFGALAIDLTYWTSGVPSTNSVSTVLIVDGCDLALGGVEGSAYSANSLLLPHTMWIRPTRKGENAWDGGGSPFTDTLLRGVHGKADTDWSGWVSGEELNAYLSENYLTEVKEKYGDDLPDSTPSVVWTTEGRTYFVDPSWPGNPAAPAFNPYATAKWALPVAGAAAALATYGYFLFRQHDYDHMDLPRPSDYARLQNARDVAIGGSIAGGALIGLGGFAWYLE